jgi:hypothetical protein
MIYGGGHESQGGNTVSQLPSVIFSSNFFFQHYLPKPFNAVG